MKTATPLKLRVSMKCLRLGVYPYLGYVSQVVTKMTGNPNYTTPTPTLAAITTGRDTLQAKADAAVGGGKNAYFARNASWDGSIMQIRELINYVQLNGQNDADILTSSGFDLTKTSTPVGPLSPPENLQATYNSVSGELLLRMKPVRGVTAGYCLQQADSATGPWVEIANTSKSRENKVTGLTPGKTYYFRTCANGTSGPSGWSSVISIMAV